MSQRRTISRSAATGESLAHRIDPAACRAFYVRCRQRQAKDTELIQYATEIKVRAERRCGELLRTMDKNKGAAGVGSNQYRKAEVQSNDATAPTLSDMGLIRDESSRYQRLAAMPDGTSGWKGRISNRTLAPRGLRLRNSRISGYPRLSRVARRAAPWPVWITQI